MNSIPRLCSALYLPASNSRAIEKSRSIPADAIIFDLEDSVAPAAKKDAREQLVAAFKEGGFGKTTVVRCNAINSADYLLDLDILGACQPDAVLVPKVFDVESVGTFESDTINRGIAGKFNTWYMIETAAAVVNLKEIVQAGIGTRSQLSCLVLGHNDLAVETGVSVEGNRQYLIPWLMQSVLIARHFNLTVLDSVYNDHKDLNGFEAEAVQARAMGFNGKSLIHPAQVEITNRVFQPGEQEMTEARAIVSAFARPENANAGVISLDGKMVERLHLAQAQRLLDQYDT